jgi:hypothetical protein
VVSAILHVMYARTIEFTILLLREKRWKALGTVSFAFQLAN